MPLMPTVERCPVVDRVAQAASRHADRSAVVTAGQRMSYELLWLRVRAWRDRCADLALRPRSLVCVVADGQADLPAALLGVRAAGLVPMLVDARRDLGVLATARPAAVIRLADDEVAPTGDPQARALPEGTGYVVFSSGSQGSPKGIAGQATGLAHFVDWEIGTLGVRPGTRFGMLTSPAFDVVYRDMLVPLCAGAELHIPSGKVRSSVSLVVPWIAEHRVEVVHIVPSLTARWTAGESRAPALRWSLFAGEPLYAEHVARWRAIAPRSRVLNLYGPAETTLAKFAYEVPAAPRPGLQPVGRPLPGTRLELAPAGTQQRIVIATPHGSLGYLPDTCGPADLARLRRDARLTRFETQDRGFLDSEGDLVVAGRLDSLVKRNGLFVDLARIEAAAASLPGVRAACCVQLQPSGRVVLAVEGPQDPSVAGLRRQLHPRLGTQLPDRIVTVDALPLLAGGKVDRRAVRAHYHEMDTHHV
jgi:non-ribosomal peptide synthetase component F